MFVFSCSVFASSTASGTWGTCPWTLNDNGMLTISAGTGGDCSVSSGSPWQSCRSDIRQIVFEEGVILPSNCQYLFYNLNHLETIDFSGIDASSVTETRSMFNGCSSLSALDLSSFASAALSGMSMSNLFFNCSELETLDVSPLNTRSVTSFLGTFNGCSKLRQLNLGNMNTSSAVQIAQMFNKCASLEELDLSNFNTRSVSSWNVGESHGRSNMFDGCSSLNKITVGPDVIISDTSRITSIGLPQGSWLAESEGQIYSDEEAGGTNLGRQETYIWQGASGTWGTCAWEIAGDTQIIHAGTGADNTVYDSPWSRLGGRVHQIILEDGVVLPSTPAASLLYFVKSLGSSRFHALNGSAYRPVGQPPNLAIRTPSFASSP